MNKVTIAWSRGMGWILASILLFSSSLAAANTPRPTTRPKPTALQSFKQLGSIIPCAIRRAGQYTRNHLFGIRRGKPGVQVANHHLGMFRGGFQSLFRYLYIIECFGQSKGMIFRYEDSDLRSLSAMAGIPVFAPKQGSQRYSRRINYYNPAWIRWATQTLIPSANAKLLGVPVQRIYQEVFQRFVRVTAYTYVFLQQKNRWDTLLKTYRNASGRDRQRLRAELRTLVQDGYGPANANEEGFYYHAGHAATFWMRRAMDETDKEVWRFFRTVLQRFDPKYLPGLSGRNLGKATLSYQIAQGKVFTLKPQDAAQLPQILKTAPPGSTIRLTAGTYTYKKALSIRNKVHLTLEGVTAGSVRIQLTDPHQDVLTIERSRRIVIRNIKAHHSVQNPPCKGSVISIRYANNILLENNVLDGSGSIGVYGYRSTNIRVRKNHVHNNSYTGLYFYYCRQVQIVDNIVENNKASLSSYHSSLTLKQNTFRKNGTK